MDNKLDDIITIRLFRHEVKEIDKLVRKYPVNWDNRSHFVRAAVVYFLNEIKTGRFKIRSWY